MRTQCCNHGSPTAVTSSSICIKQHVIDAQKQHIIDTHPKMNMMRLLQEHNRTFLNWFTRTIFTDDSALNTLRLLAVGPNLNVPTWKGYDINNYSFYTKSQDDKSSVQNDEVSVDGNLNHFF